MRSSRALPWAVTVACAALLLGCTTDVPGTSPDDGGSAAPTTGEADTTLRYVALGDSFTAAPGVAETDTSDGCQRSTGNYPALVADALGEVTLVDRSCIGAETRDLTRRQPVGAGSIPPQLEAVTRGTDLVTLSLGGNDFGLFEQLLARCLSRVEQDPAGSPCQDASRAQGDPWRALGRTVEQRLVRAVEEIGRRAADARVLLVGYPQLAPADGACRDLLPLADGDLPFAREVNKEMTDTLRRAARRTGATYVDVWSASAGHDICAEEPWTNGLGFGAEGAFPLHPLPAGQAAIADLVVDAAG